MKTWKHILIILMNYSLILVALIMQSAAFLFWVFLIITAPIIAYLNYRFATDTKWLCIYDINYIIGSILSGYLIIPLATAKETDGYAYVLNMLGEIILIIVALLSIILSIVSVYVKYRKSSLRKDGEI